MSYVENKKPYVTLQDKKLDQRKLSRIPLVPQKCYCDAEIMENRDKRCVRNRKTKSRNMIEVPLRSRELLAALSLP